MGATTEQLRQGSIWLHVSVMSNRDYFPRLLRGRPAEKELRYALHVTAGGGDPQEQVDRLVAVLRESIFSLMKRTEIPIHAKRWFTMVLVQLR